MSDEDLVYLQLKTRTERTEVNPELAARIRKWNKLDSAIYDHFYKVFNEKIKEFGTDRMAKEVIQLHNGIARVKQECVEVKLKIVNINTIEILRPLILSGSIAGSCEMCYEKELRKIAER